MKIIRTNVRIPSPRAEETPTEETPADALRRLLRERAARSTSELRRRLSGKR